MFGGQFQTQMYLQLGHIVNFHPAAVCLVGTYLKFVYFTVFPSELKTACLIPTLKGDNNMIISDYRPVSVLTVFFKIFERIMYNRLFNFITTHSIL